MHQELICFHMLIYENFCIYSGYQQCSSMATYFQEITNVTFYCFYLILCYIWAQKKDLRRTKSLGEIKSANVKRMRVRSLTQPFTNLKHKPDSPGKYTLFILLFGFSLIHSFTDSHRISQIHTKKSYFAVVIYGIVIKRNPT